MKNYYTTTQIFTLSPTPLGWALIISNKSFILQAWFCGKSHLRNWNVWNINRNAKKLSNDNCKTYSPPGLHSLFLPPCTLAPMPLYWSILHRGIFQLQHPGRQSRWPCLKWRQRGGLSLHTRPWNLIIGLHIVIRWKRTGIATFFVMYQTQRICLTTFPNTEKGVLNKRV